MPQPIPPLCASFPSRREFEWLFKFASYFPTHVLHSLRLLSFHGQIFKVHHFLALARGRKIEMRPFLQLDHAIEVDGLYAH